MDRTAIVDDLTGYFATREDVVAAYLFGSIARGERRESSDADVAVMLRNGKPEAIADFDRVFELQVRTQYFDFLPILIRYRESLLGRASATT